MPHPSDLPYDDEGLKLAAEVRNRFLVMTEPDEILSGLPTELGSQYARVRDAFRTNISGVAAVATMPFRLAHAAVAGKHHQRYVLAAKIRALPIPGEPTSPSEIIGPRIRQEAQKSYDEFLATVDGQVAIRDDVLDFLQDAHRGLGADAAAELLLQCTALTWAAVEVAARDTFEAVVNQHPSLVEALARDEIARKRFDLTQSKVPRELLARHGYNLSGSMGTVLIEQQDLSDVQTIKSVYAALFPTDAALATALGDTALRHLCARRHLIVHRRGVIDETFVRATSSSQQPGTRLILTAHEVEAGIRTATATVGHILRAASAYS